MFPTPASTDWSSSKFLAAAASIGDRSAQAKRTERIDALVPEGTLIPGILETAIVSDLPGQVRAIVSQDVYSFDGRRILIPTGTRLIGEYQSEITRGQTRIFVVWTRMLRDDGVSVRLNSIGADSLGRAGLTGRVDKKFRERFGAAILISVIDGTVQAIANAQTSSNGDGTTVQFNPNGSGSIMTEILKNTVDVPPTVVKNQGERIQIMVARDVDFRSVYELRRR